MRRSNEFAARRRRETGALWRCAEPPLSFTLWGYDLAGDALEDGARFAESPESMRWDHQQSWLDNQYLVIHGEHIAPPRWWCLPWVADAVASEHIDGPETE